jgi:acyl-CoA synthetase (AMP-forming)/AMP-acid ligase II
VNPLIAFQIILVLSAQSTLASLTDRATSLAHRRRQLLRQGDREAGLSTLEITVLALGLFLLAGVAVAVLTNATNTRLNKIK